MCFEANQVLGSDLKLLLEAATTVAAGSGVWIALKNWRAGEDNRKVSLEHLRVAAINSENAAKWKRAELAAEYIRPLLEDEETVFALRSIDWEIGTMPIPERHRAMMQDERTIRHDCGLLAEAMVPELTARAANSHQAILYRLCMDTLFTRLEWIANRVDLGLIDVADIPDIKYWAAMICHWKYAPEGYDKNKVFPEFLKEMGYCSTLKLLRSMCSR